MKIFSVCLLLHFQMFMSYVYFASTLYLAVQPRKSDLKWRIVNRRNCSIQNGQTCSRSNQRVVWGADETRKNHTLGIRRTQCLDILRARKLFCFCSLKAIEHTIAVSTNCKPLRFFFFSHSLFGRNICRGGENTVSLLETSFSCITGNWKTVIIQLSVG